MSFKIRRVVSGLSPSEHVADTKLSSRPSASSSSLGDGSPRLKQSRVKRLSVDIEDFIADGNNSLLNDKGRSSERFGASSASNRKHSNAISIFNQASFPHTREPQAESLNGGVSLTREKIIDDNNDFRPSPSHHNGRRMDLGINPRMEKIEFDSSDQNSPQKLQEPFSLTSQFAAPRSPFLAESDLSEGVPERRASETNLPFEQMKSVSYTPRRSSPLRKELQHSSHTNSAAGDLVQEIRQSSALRSRSTREILDQINSSMDRIRANASPQGNSSDASSDAEDQVSGVASPQEELPGNTIRLQGLSDFVSEDVLKNIEETRSRPVSPRPVAGRTTFQSGSPIEKDSFKSKKRPRYAEATESSAKQLKISSKTANYGAWSFEKWDKLKRLVDSPIPNSVIIKNAIVMKELGCDNEQELQQRVEFLLRNKTR